MGYYKPIKIGKAHIIGEKFHNYNNITNFMITANFLKKDADTMLGS